MLEQIRGYKISYPVAYDVESKYLLDNGKTPQELANQTNVFCKAIAAAGYRPMLYGNNQWLTNYVDVSQVPYDIWYARYGTTGEFQNREDLAAYRDRFRGRHHRQCLHRGFLL